MYNATSGLFTYANLLAAGVNECINGNCDLPGETTVVNGGCQSAVSVFTVDYDAPSGKETKGVMKALEPLVIKNTTGSKRSMCKLYQCWSYLKVMLIERSETGH